MSPNETLFIGSNNSILKDVINNSAFVNFQVCDFPGHLEFADPDYDVESIFQTCESLIFVIDAQVNNKLYFCIVILILIFCLYQLGRYC